MSVELVISGAALGVATIFVLMLRYVTRRYGQHVPAAVVVDGAPRWVEGRGRAQMARRADAFGRVAIAFGLTSVAVMVLCAIGLIVLAIIA